MPQFHCRESLAYAPLFSVSLDAGLRLFPRELIGKLRSVGCRRKLLRKLKSNVTIWAVLCNQLIYYGVHANTQTRKSFKSVTMSNLCRDFTLVELMVVVAIAGVLAEPSFVKITQQYCTMKVVSTFVGDLQFARNEAIKAGIAVSLYAFSSSVPSLAALGATAGKQGGLFFQMPEAAAFLVQPRTSSYAFKKHSQIRIALLQATYCQR